MTDTAAVQSGGVVLAPEPALADVLTTQASTPLVPTLDDPAINAPTTNDPATQNPLVAQPTAENRVVENPLAENPVVIHPTNENSIMENPPTENPATKNAATDNPTAEAPTTLAILPPSQKLAMESLLSGKTVKQSAELAGVSRFAIHHWLKNDANFRALYKQWMQHMHDSARSRLMVLSEKAAAAIEQSLDSGDAKTALLLLKGLGIL